MQAGEMVPGPGLHEQYSRLLLKDHGSCGMISQSSIKRNLRPYPGKTWTPATMQTVEVGPATFRVNSASSTHYKIPKHRRSALQQHFVDNRQTGIARTQEDTLSARCPGNSTTDSDRDEANSHIHSACQPTNQINRLLTFATVQKTNSREGSS